MRIRPAVRAEVASASLYGSVLSCTDADHMRGWMLQPMSAMLGATSSVFLQFSGLPMRGDCVQRSCYEGNAPESLDFYLDGYYQRDPIMQPTLQWLRSGGDGRGSSVTLVSGLPRWCEQSYYKQFLKPFDIGLVLAVVVPVRTLSRVELMCLGFHRPHAAEPFLSGETRRLRDLMPLLQTVLSNLAYREAMEVSGTVLEALSDSGKGVGFVVLDEDLMVRNANERGLSQLGLYQPGGETRHLGSHVFGELRQRLFGLDSRDQRSRRFSFSVVEAGSDRIATLDVDVRSFKAPDGRLHYLLVTCRPDDRQAVLEACARAQLSEREVDVVQLVFAGQSNAGIGQQLGISLRAVENHLRSIYSKVGVKSRTQLVSHLLGVQ